MYLLPKPQKIEYKTGKLKSRTVYVRNFCQDSRIEHAVKKLPLSDEGVELEIYAKHTLSGNICGYESFGDCKEPERYMLTVEEDHITIIGESEAGAFYGIQTLRQLLQNGEVLSVVSK